MKRPAGLCSFHPGVGGLPSSRLCPVSLSPASIATAPLRRTLWLRGVTRQSQRTSLHAPQSHLSVPLVSHRETVRGLGDEDADIVGLSCTSRTHRSDRPSLSYTHRGLSKWQHIATVRRAPSGPIHSANSPCAARVSEMSQAASPPSRRLTFVCGPLHPTPSQGLAKGPAGREASGPHACVGVYTVYVAGGRRGPSHQADWARKVGPRPWQAHPRTGQGGQHWPLDSGPGCRAGLGACKELSSGQCLLSA